MSDFLVQGNRLAEIRKAMELRNISAFCRHCQRGGYLIYEGSSPTLLLDNEGSLQSQNIPVIILICNYCGHVEEYSSIVLGLFRTQGQG